MIESSSPASSSASTAASRSSSAGAFGQSSTVTIVSSIGHGLLTIAGTARRLDDKPSSALALRDAGQQPWQHVTTLIETHLEQVEQRIAELLATRTVLRNLHQRAHGVDPADGGPERICRILTTV